MRAYLATKPWAQPGVSLWAQLVFVGFVLTLAVFDGLLRGLHRQLADILDFAWAFGLFLLVFTSPFIGLTSFSDKYSTLLEYLPIRRRDAWLANALHGLAFPLALFFAGALPRVLLLGREPSPGTIELLTAGGLLLLGFSIGAFARFLFRRQALGVVPVALLLIAAGMIVGGIFSTLQLEPTGLDWVLLMMASSLYLLLGSLALGSQPLGQRPHRRLARVVLVGALVLGAIGSTLFVMLHRWRDLAGDTLVSATLHRVDHARVLMTLMGERSGSHAVAVDVDTGRCEYLGRGPNAAARGGMALPGATPLQSVRFKGDRLFPGTHLTWIDPSKTRRWLSPEALSTFQPWTYTNFVTHDGRWLLLFVHGKEGDEFVVLNADAQHVRTVPMPGFRQSRMAVAAQGLLFSPVHHPTELIHLDFATGKRRELTVQGAQPYTLAEDLHAGIYLRRKRDEHGLERSALIHVNHLDGAVSTLIDFDEGPPRSLHPYREQHVPPPMIAGIRGLPKARWEPQVFFDPSLERAVWLRESVHGSWVSAELIAIDVKTGTRSVLRPSSDFARRPLADNSPRPDFEGLGFAEGGEHFIYRSGPLLLWVELSSAHVVRKIGVGKSAFDLSPQGASLVVSRGLDGFFAPKTYAVHTGTEPHLTASPGRSGRILFLDEQHLMQFRDESLVVLNLRGELERSVRCTGLWGANDE